MNQQEKKALSITACKVRMGVIEGTYHAKSGHPGGSLSFADIFTYLYFKEMNIDPKDPKNPDRDRFVLSKGHTAPGLYAALANRGYFPVEVFPSQPVWRWALSMRTRTCGFTPLPATARSRKDRSGRL